MVPGCSNVESDRGTPTPSPPSDSDRTPTPSPPDVALADVSPVKGVFYVWEDVRLDIEFENRGEKAAYAEYAVEVEGEELVDDFATVEGGETVTERVRLSISRPDPGEYRYTVSTEGDSLDGDFRVARPVKKPRTVPSHTVLRDEDHSTDSVDRVRYHVEVRGNARNEVWPPNREELLDVCRKIILEELPTGDRHAIGFDIWREEQTVGEETSHATITWGPNGSWDEAGTRELGDYTDHEFSVDGAQYLATEGVGDIRTDEWDFRVEFDVVNRGLVPGALSGEVSARRAPSKEFEVDLDPGERTTVLYEATYDGPRDYTIYTVEAYGIDTIHGRTTGQIEFY